MRRPRRNHSARFKARVALAAMRGDKTLAELSSQFDVHANQITEWKNQLLAKSEAVFMTKAERQAAALGLARSSVYYRPEPLTQTDLDLMRRIDALNLDYPFAGSRMTKRLLVTEGYVVGRRHVTSLMRRMGIEALEEAIQIHGAPEIVNTDQGSQFTSEEFVAAVQGCSAKVSMDGKGAWRDNVFIERFWKTLKYEAVYLRAYETMGDARHHLKEYLAFYNTRRPHSSLEDRTPDAVYFQTAIGQELKAAA